MLFWFSVRMRIKGEILIGAASAASIRSFGGSGRSRIYVMGHDTAAKPMSAPAEGLPVIRHMPFD